MIMSIRNGLILMTIISLLSSSVFAAARDSDERTTDRELSALLQNVARTFDANAIVFAKGLRIKSIERIRPPGVPFILEDIAPSSTDRAVQNVTRSGNETTDSNPYSKLKVTVFSTSGKIPNSVLSVMRRITEGHAEKIEFVVERLPKDLQILENRPTEKISEPVTVPDEKAWEPILSETLQKFANSLDGLSEFYTKLEFQGSVLKSAAAGFFLALCLLTLSGGLIFFLMQRRLQSLIRSGLAEISTAIEKASGKKTQQPNSSSIARPEASSRTLSTAAELRELNALTDDGLLALVSDCYWSMQDEYGAFLWRHIHPDRKLVMLKRMPEIAEYARFLLDKAEINLGLDQDPAYLRPLPVWHLDNQDLTHFVRRFPDCLQRLSPLRLASLQLSPKERILLYSNVKKNEPQKMPDIPPTASPLRALAQSMTIKIRSLEDEIEVLEMKSVSLAIIAEVPSLGWILRLPKQNSLELLKKLSARELAAAWIGPPDVLNQIAEQLGDKKSEMLNSILDQINPSRESDEFYRIHQMIVAELQRLKLQNSGRSQPETATPEDREYLDAG